MPNSDNGNTRAQALAVLARTVDYLQEQQRTNPNLEPLADGMSAVLTLLRETDVDLVSIEELIAQLESLRERLLAVDWDALDPLKIRQAVLTSLAVWQSEVDGRLLALEQHAATLVSRVSAIENKIKDVDFDRLHPNTIKEEVLAALASWQEALETSINNLDSRLNELDTQAQQIQGQVNTLEGGQNNLFLRVTELERRVDLIPAIDPGAIRQQVLDALRSWQQQMEGALSDLRASLQRIESLTATLTGRITLAENRIGVLEQRVDNIVVPPPPDLVAIKQAVLAALEAWKQAVDRAVGVNTSDIGALKNAVQTLQADIGRMIAAGLDDPEKIKKLIFDALGPWQGQVNGRLDLLDGQLGTAKLDIEQLLNWKSQVEPVLTGIQSSLSGQQTDISSLNTNLQTLRNRIEALERDYTPEKVKALVLQALATWQEIVLNRLDALESDVTSLNTLASTLQSGLKTATDFIEEWKLKLPGWPESIKQLVLSALSEWQNTVDGSLETLTQTSQNHHTRIDTLESSLATLTKRVDEWPQPPSLTEVVAAVLLNLTDWKAALEDTISGIQQGHTNLQESLNNLTERVKAVENQGVEWTKGIADLDAKITDEVRQINALLNSIPRIPDILLAVRDDLKDWQDAVDRLRKRVDVLEERLDDNTALRLSRRCLQGRGIVCGFRVQHTASFTVKISAGSGITSDGRLIAIAEDRHYTHYKPFPAEKKSRYPLFKRENQVQQYPVWELVQEKEDEGAPAVKALTPQRAKDLEKAFIADKVVLAYLDPDVDASEQVDSPAIRFLLMQLDDVLQEAGAAGRIRFLTADHPDEDEVWKESFSPADEIPTEQDLYKALRPALLLKEITLPRFGFFQPEDCDPEELDEPEWPLLIENGLTIDEIYRTFKKIITDVIRNLNTEMGKIINTYHQTFFPFNDVKEFTTALSLLSDKWAAYQDYNERQKENEAKKYYVQYFYDWVRDLVNAYHELREALLEMMVVCCTDDRGPFAVHPRHLLLGPAQRDEDYGLAAPLRHEFLAPPIFNGNGFRVESCRLYFRRWFVMVREFYLPDWSDDKLLNRFADNETVKPDMSKIRITPGRFFDKPLSQQTIPYYYPLSQGTQSLHRFWNYAKSKSATEDHLLSYHANDSEDSYSHLPSVIRPLHATLDPYDFFRIEGCIGRKTGDEDPNNQPLNQLIHLVETYNLDILVEQVDVAFAELDFSMTGAEHVGGVWRGGTFILLTYEGKVIGDAALKYRVENNNNDGP